MTISPSAAVESSTGEASFSRGLAILGLIYSGIAYLLFLITITFFAAAVSGVYMPWRGGLAGSVMAAVLIDIALVLVFASQHTIMARHRFKEAWTQIVPAHLERSTFVLLTSLILGGITLSWQAIPGQAWNVTTPALRTSMWALVVLAFLGLVASSFMIDHFHLFGLKQTWQYFRRQPQGGARFREPLAYSKIRHPMMLAVLVIMWATPTMSATQLLMASLFSIYVIVGIHFEERELAYELGEPYLEYKKRVPMLLPRLR